MQEVRVFLSYSHKDLEWKDKVHSWLKVLKWEMNIDIWDDTKIKPGEDWKSKIMEALEHTNIAISLISKDYLASDFIREEEIPALMEINREKGMLIVPILISPSPFKQIPWLRKIQMLMFPRDGKSLEEIKPEHMQKKALVEFVEKICEIIRGSLFQTAQPYKIEINRLPRTGSILFYREKELDLLDEAWSSEDKNIVSFVAYGGMGKSTLINSWIDLMDVENFRGAERVFGWSFFSQGMRERVTSADQFISEALIWFGDEDPTKGSPWEKGRRLAELICQRKTLLILDGMEPLQSCFEYEKGKVKDIALATLLTKLTKKNNGLCIITTREKIPELEGIKDLEKTINSFQQINLEHITEGAGRALLRVGGIRGKDAELEEITGEFGHNALAVNLLAAYLYTFPGHDVSNAKDIPDLDIPSENGRHPRRVLEAFGKILGDGPELDILRILGLFDRPVTMAAIEAILKDLPISGLTEHLKAITELERYKVLNRMRREYKLLAPENICLPDIIDCHPIIREHFGEKLRKNNPTGWKEAHKRLFEYYKNLPKKEKPDTLREMEPLYMAVYHGSQADRYNEALVDVFINRIRRKKEHYSFFILGAVEADIAALANFFIKIWDKPARGIDEKNLAYIYNEVGSAFRVLGKIDEARRLIKKSIEIYEKMEDHENISRSARNYSKLLMELGNLKEAFTYAEKACNEAKLSRNKKEIYPSHATLARVLHFQGKFKEARDHFEEAIKISNETGRKTFGLHETHFCDLLSEMKDFKRLDRLFETTLMFKSEKEANALDIGLYHYSRGKELLFKFLEENLTDLKEAEKHLTKAIDHLESAMRRDELGFAHLICASLFRIKKDFIKAEKNLERVEEIIKQNGIEILKPDYNLEYFKFYMKSDPIPKAKTIEFFKKANEEIAKIGYYRRESEIKELNESIQMLF